MTLPTTDLKHVTIYKNDLAFIERSAKCRDGRKKQAASTQQQTFKLDVPNANRALTMATIAVTAGGSAGVMVDHDMAKTPPPSVPERQFGFTLGARVGLGNFLASVVGAEVALSVDGGKAMMGLVVMVDERTRVVPGTTEVTEKDRKSVV